MGILVVGAGSIGRRHINNLNSRGYGNIDVVDINDANLDYARKNFRINETFSDLGAAISSKKYDVAFILTPPVYHIPMALELAEEGIDLFIEKPLSHSLDGVDDLIDIKEKKDLVVMVGYNQRFNFGLKKLKSYISEGKIGKIYYIRAEFGQYLPDWRPQQDYRRSYTAVNNLGGGILLDGSHEIDYVLWLVDSNVKEIKAVYNKVSDLEIDVEDIVEIILKFENNAMASIHSDMVEQGYNRYCKILGENGGMRWTFKDSTLEVYGTDSNGSTIVKHETDSNHSYLEELKHFFDCIKNRTEPLSNVYTARETLDLVMKIKLSGGV
jgi:predicted dehydrogenase